MEEFFDDDFKNSEEFVSEIISDHSLCDFTFFNNEQQQQQQQTSSAVFEKEEIITFYEINVINGGINDNIEFGLWFNENLFYLLNCTEGLLKVEGKKREEEEGEIEEERMYYPTKHIRYERIHCFSGSTVGVGVTNLGNLFYTFNDQLIRPFIALEKERLSNDSPTPIFALLRVNGKNEGFQFNVNFVGNHRHPFVFPFFNNPYVNTNNYNNSSNDNSQPLLIPDKHIIEQAFKKFKNHFGAEFLKVINRIQKVFIKKRKIMHSEGGKGGLSDNHHHKKEDEDELMMSSMNCQKPENTTLSVLKLCEMVRNMMKLRTNESFYLEDILNGETVLRMHSKDEDYELISTYNSSFSIVKYLNEFERSQKKYKLFKVGENNNSVTVSRFYLMNNDGKELIEQNLKFPTKNNHHQNDNKNNTSGIMMDPEDLESMKREIEEMRNEIANLKEEKEEEEKEKRKTNGNHQQDNDNCIQKEELDLRDEKIFNIMNERLSEMNNLLVESLRENETIKQQNMELEQRIVHLENELFLLKESSSSVFTMNKEVKDIQIEKMRNSLKKKKKQEITNTIPQIMIQKEEEDQQQERLKEEDNFKEEEQQEQEYTYEQQEQQEYAYEEEEGMKNDEYYGEENGEYIEQDGEVYYEEYYEEEEVEGYENEELEQQQQQQEIKEEEVEEEEKRKKKSIAHQKLKEIRLEVKRNKIRNRKAPPPLPSKQKPIVTIAPQYYSEFSNSASFTPSTTNEKQMNNEEKETDSRFVRPSKSPPKRPPILTKRPPKRR